MEETIIDTAGIKKEIRKKSNITSLLLIITILVINGAYLLISTILSTFTDYFNVTPLSDLTNGLIVQCLIATPICIFIGSKMTGLRVFSLVQKSSVPKKKIAKWIFLAIGVSQFFGILFNMFFTFLQAKTGTSLNAVSFVPNDIVGDQIAMFLLTALVAPIVEEFLFRGVMLTPYIRYGQWFAVIITGAMFGLYHVNYAQLIGTMLCGTAFCFLAVKTRSIIAPIIAHIINNTFCAIQYLALSKIDMDEYQRASDLILSGNSSEGMEIMAPMLLPLFISASISIIMVFGGLVATIIFFVDVKNNKAEYSLGTENCPALTFGQKLGAFASAPATIVMFVIIVCMTIINAFPEILQSLVKV